MGTNKDPEVARWFAAMKHKGGKKYGQQPYTFHLESAVEQLKEHILPLPALRFHDHDVIICATYLHDVIEDCGVTSAELDEVFCGPVVELVQAVTDGPGKNRKERKQKVYQEIRIVGPAALAVKCADRLANALSAGLTKDEDAGMLQMYRKEQPTFEMELTASIRGSGNFIPGFHSVMQKIRDYLGMS
jgi:(p)ppGpp synthase/HD superfamily hydrolase